MFQLLIVDDEPHAVQMIASCMNWELLLVGRIHTAHNIRQAKQIFEQFPVHMMICDIEMPQGSGLELLAWTKEHYPDSESVFLTCHSDFQYARKAVKLGSLDYLLKPVQFDELRAAVEKGLSRVLERTKQKAEQEQGHYFGKLIRLQQPVMMERFWQDLFYERIAPQREPVKAAISERHLPIGEKDELVPILVAIQRWTEKLSKREEKMLEYALLNTAEHLLLQHVTIKQAVRLASDMLLVLMPADIRGFAPEQLVGLCESYIASALQYFRCELKCYVGKPDYVFNMQQQFTALLVMKESNVSSVNKVMLLSEASLREGLPAPVDMSVWLELMKRGAFDALTKEISGYMARLSQREHLTARELQCFLQSFLQILYHFIQSKGLLSYEVLGEVLGTRLQSEAVRSVAALQAWVMKVLKLTIENCGVDGISMMTKLKGFVKQHLDQPISREDLAAHVNLHPDYLSRWFKKETGKSVTAYIIEEKIAMAKELLLTSDLTVSDVALSVGYSNFSYFSKVFKQEVDMNPNQYRKANGQNNARNRSESQ